MADVLLLCSQKETFSLACAESLCCGTPVAGFKSGAPEAIFKGPYAVFVEYGDLQALHGKLKHVINVKPSMEKRVARYGRHNFSNQVMYREYFCLFLNKYGNGIEG